MNIENNNDKKIWNIIYKMLKNIFEKKNYSIIIIVIVLALFILVAINRNRMRYKMIHEGMTEERKEEKKPDSTINVANLI